MNRQKTIDIPCKLLSLDKKPPQIIDIWCIKVVIRSPKLINAIMSYDIFRVHGSITNRQKQIFQRKRKRVAY